ncbi:MAG TPA: hypothetical protein VFO57_03120 [Burkholderiales bacterium]|nr:hypothetical protein [Burkholderiales bacterium]
MAQQQEGSLSPEVVLDQMKKNGVTHVVWLPDSETNWLDNECYATTGGQPVPHAAQGTRHKAMKALPFGFFLLPFAS